ncbi:leucine-rich repeat domain-containing protein [Chitinophaga qingshengii]|uniref:Leucine-rich repeat domain-containing protein n=1 Tax=Chitinophaga qingshengii TaxID=1569794 RepID=A0ABR7TIP6_9BACT|nr:leucine-rich repeat domain-containing protein [Chitinophaga qingshengii]MBC9928944.1 leucine-rich repeat domain-containing protein [Chitinophaga qingshengii]
MMKTNIIASLLVLFSLLSTAQDSLRSIYQRAGFDLSKVVAAEELTLENGTYFFTAMGQHTPLSEILHIDSLDINNQDINIIFRQLKYTLHLKYLNISGSNLKYGGQIKNLHPLRNLRELTYLNISYNEVTDLTPLRGLTQLRYLDVRYNSPSSLAGLENMRHLEVLLLGTGGDRLPIKDLSPLKDKPALRVLKLPYSSIVNITPILNSKKLQQLDLNNNKILGTITFSGFTELEELNLSDNQITELKISSMPRLRNLYISSNHLATLPPLFVFPALEQLSARFNRLTQLTCTTPLNSLTEVDLLGNQLQEINFVRCMPALQTADLTNNKIKDMRPLLSLPQVKITCPGNPVDSSLLNPTEKTRLLK